MINVTKGYLEKVKEELQNTLEAEGGCDHSVGICTCGLEYLILDTRAYLEEIIWCYCEEPEIACSKCKGRGWYEVSN